MDDLESLGRAADERLFIKLPLAEDSIEAGFPAPNGGYVEGGLDVNEFLVRHPKSTYVYRVHGRSMSESGIMDGDYVLVDSAAEVKNHDIVVARIDNEYTIKEVQFGPPLRFIPHNPDFEPLEINDFSSVTIIGPVCGVVRRYNSAG